MMRAFLVCQLYVVLFIGLHDWLPLGRLNNLAGIRAVDSRPRLLLTTLLSVLPFFIGFAGTCYYFAGRFPSWLFWLLWITYGFALYGVLRAWYLPYLVYRDAARVARYQERFADTHAFLPMRNGIRPDTLHVTFHGVLAVTVTLLWVLTRSGRLGST
ncbi:MAG: hypothetical protein WAU49_21795 [Steroidobacteraceae bacterium]